MAEKRLSVVYSLSGVPNSNDYKMTIENLNRAECGEVKAVISKINRRNK